MMTMLMTIITIIIITVAEDYWHICLLGLLASVTGGS
jgi:nitrate/nitrite transporter NarK